jgi:tagatose 6-phosphate kinase
VILVAGLSPAWQQILRFDAFSVGEVNRAAEAHWCASGKAVNVAWALKRLGADVKLLSTVGGTSGEQLREQVEREQIDAEWVTTAQPTRVCTTIIDTPCGSITELVENTPPASDAELAAFLAAFERLARDAQLVLLTGSLPTGTPETYYRDLLRRVPCPMLLDFRGAGLVAALEVKPLLVKPNREELLQTCQAHGKSVEVTAGIEWLRRGGAQWVLITDGGGEIFAAGAEANLRIMPPRVSVVNPIGSGDCLLAGIAWGLQENRPMDEAIRLGVAAASLNASELLPARLYPAAVRSVAASLAVKKV